MFTNEHEQEKALNHLKINMNITKIQLQILKVLIHTNYKEPKNLNPIKKKKTYIKTLDFFVFTKQIKPESWVQKLLLSKPYIRTV